MHRLLFLTLLFVHLASGGLKTHSYASYQSDAQQSIQQTSPIVRTTVEKTFATGADQQAPVRWRTSDNNRYDVSRESTNQKINLQSTMETKFESSYQASIESKHEELRRRTLRIRTLTSQQNDLRKQLESNETILNEQLKENNLENLNLARIQMLVNSVQNCISQWQRIQIELQKLYRDQIFEEKKLLELYKVSRPNDRDSHNQLDRAIERWELIYNQLLTMQLNEKKLNEERERKYENLLVELETAQRSPYLSKSPEYYSSTLSKITPSSKMSPSQTAQSKPIEMSSVSSHSSYSSSMKTSGQEPQIYFSQQSTSQTGQEQPQIFYSQQSTGKTGQNYPILGQTSKIRPGLEENSLIFRRPESSSLKDVKCLDKWFEDLGREDAEWIARNQLKNEELFRELVRMQKLQWDSLLVEHNKNKQKSIPQTFDCKLESQSLCDEEEANFKRKFNDYRIDKYPSNIDQFNSQQNQQPIIDKQDSQHQKI